MLIKLRVSLKPDPTGVSECGTASQIWTNLEARGKARGKDGCGQSGQGRGEGSCYISSLDGPFW